MGQTTLMECKLESIIRRPAVVDEKSIILGAQDRYRLLVSSPWQDGVYGYLRAYRHVQPLEPATHFPAGFVHAVDRSLLRSFYQPCIGGLRAARHPCQRPAQSSAANFQPKAIGKDLARMSQRQPHLFIENGGQGQRLRPQLHAADSQCIGSLQGMAPLDPPPAVATVAHGNIKTAHDGP